MSNFELDSRLAADCLLMGESDLSLFLMVNNSLVPWFILVPRTSEIEILDLPKAEQGKLFEEILLVSDFVKKNFEITKLNIGAIGNIVSQMHIHIVGRDPSDFCWPNVVWGAGEKQAYSEEGVGEIKAKVRADLGRHFRE